MKGDIMTQAHVPDVWHDSDRRGSILDQVNQSAQKLNQIQPTPSAQDPPPNSATRTVAQHVGGAVQAAANGAKRVYERSKEIFD